MSDFGNILRRPDGSFVIERGGQPYHVPDAEEFAELFAQVAAYAEERPEMVTDEAPPAPPTPEELAEARRAEILAELAALDAARVRPLAELALNPGAAYPAAKLGELEAKAAALRQELAGLNTITEAEYA